MIEFTVEELLLAENALSRLAYANVPIAVAYQVSKIVKTVSNELKTIRENQLKLAEKYGEKDEDGKLVERDGIYPVKPEHQEEFSKEMQALLKETCNLNINKISIERLDGCINFSASEFNTLEKFFMD